jgi:hypothetical protein
MDMQEFGPSSEGGESSFFFNPEELSFFSTELHFQSV